MKGDYSRWNPPPRRRTLLLRKPNQDSLAAMQERIDRQHRFRMMKMRNGPGAGGGGLSQHPGSPIASTAPIPPIVITPGQPPTDINISPTAIPELRDGAVIGIVTVTDADLPNDYFFYSISDGRFEIVDGVFKLKSGSQLVFADEQSVMLTVGVTDSGGNPFAKVLTFTVTEQVAPVTNHPPSNVLLDNRTISDTELGAVVGNVQGVDEDMPDDTLVLTVDDPRFVIIPTGPATGLLRLKPNKFVSHLLEPNLTLVLTATDAGGLSTQQSIIITVTDIAPPDLANAYFVAPVAQGAGNGSSFANAYGVASLNAVISLARANSKQILLGSHLGVYPGNQILLSEGGIASALVIIRGVNAAGEESSVLFQSNRGTNGGNGQWAVGGAAGSTIFKFLAGADHLLFKNINFLNCGNGCFYFSAPVNDITIDTCNAQNVRRFIENVLSAPATHATITALRVRNVLVEGFSKEFARIGYDGNNIQFENCVGDSMFQDGDNFAIGIGLEATAHDIWHYDCTMRNMKDVSPNQGPPQTFYNGDGFTSEHCPDIHYIRCHATNNTDAGYDSKSPSVEFTDCTAAGNKENYKIWGVAVLTRCHGYDPQDRYGDTTWFTSQVENEGQTPNGITLIDCTFVDNSPLTRGAFVFAENAPNATITTINTSVQTHASVPVLYNRFGAGTATFDNKSGPPFTVDPIISAIATAGETSTVTPGTATGGVTDAFQWMRSDPTVGFVYIDDAVSAGYTAIADDVGHTIACRQFTVDANGYMTEATSAASAVITATSLVNLTPPVITGPLGVNGILGVNPGTYDGIPQPTFAYTWSIGGGAPIAGSTYTVITADIGKTIVVTEAATNASGTINTDSAAVGPAVASLATAYVAPTAAGIADGSSFANALGWASIDSVVAAMAHPGTIYLANHLGNYTNQVRIKHGGSAVDPLVILDDEPDGNHLDGHQVPYFNSGGTRSPVEIIGVDAALVPGLATFIRGRTDWVLPFEGTLVDPFTTTAGSNVVSVHAPGHLMPGSRQIVFLTTPGDPHPADVPIVIDGLTILSTAYLPTVTGPDDFTITIASGTAVAGLTGGGTVKMEVASETSQWPAVGTSSIFLGTGASNLKLSYMDFHRCGSGAIQVDSSGVVIDNLEIANCAFYNCQRFFEQADHTAVVTGLYIHDLVGVGFSKSGIRLRGFTSMVVIEDVDMNAGRQDRDNFCEGIEHNDSCHDTAIRRANIRNATMTSTAGDFWNADCISGERSNQYILILDTTVSGATDAGIDCKAPNTIVRRVTSRDNKEGLKLWGYTGVIVDNCLLQDSRMRGGSWFPSLLELNSPANILFNGPDATIKSTTLEYTGTAGRAVQTDTISNVIARQLENTITNFTPGTDVFAGNALNLYGTLADATGPVISTPNTASVYGGQSLFIPLTADEGASWSVVGGTDQALFAVVDSTIIGCHVVQQGQYLRMDAQEFTGIDDIRVVTIRALNAGRNPTDLTITVTILAGAPAYTFRCLWEGANNATTATDIAGGKTITFAGNAKLTTTSPLEGVSSVIFDGSGDRCSLSDHADWDVLREFSIACKFTASALPASSAFLMAHGSTSTDTNWRLELLSTGVVRLVAYSTTGTSTLVSSAAGLVTTGVQYELAVDRDSIGTTRVYLDGAMVASVGGYGSGLKSTAGTFGIGGGSGTNYFTGKMDDTRFMNNYALWRSDSGYTVV